MPNPMSWYFHHLPRPVHRVEVVGNFVVQLGVPWLLFAPQPVAGAAAAAIVATQLWLIASGNYAWLNWLTIVLALPALGDGILGSLLPVEPPDVALPPVWHTGLMLALGAVVAVLSYWPARNMLSRRQLMNYSFNRLHLVNTYGAFGSVTRERYEVIVEGTTDDDPLTARWREYAFKGKPGDPRRRPPQVAPYHLRLDWLMWFVPFNPRVYPEWFVALAHKLLEADRRTLRLLHTDPFSGEAPRFVRARFFLYRFTTQRERRETGAWWVRTPVADYLPPVSLESAVRR
jgi:predicted small integral membrane protein